MKPKRNTKLSGGALLTPQRSMKPFQPKKPLLSISLSNSVVEGIFKRYTVFQSDGDTTANVLENLHARAPLRPLPATFLAQVAHDALWRARLLSDGVTPSADQQSGEAGFLGS